MILNRSFWIFYKMINFRHIYFYLWIPTSHPNWKYWY